MRTVLDSDLKILKFGAQSEVLKNMNTVQTETKQLS